jgi:hypothetical protein
MTPGHFTLLATALLGALATLSLAPAQAQDAIREPAAKTIGQAKPEIVPSLIVLNSDGAKLDGTTLTLTGVSPNAIIFADRPVRSARHALTRHLLEEWGTGNDSFAVDPPNATISVLSKEADTVEDAVVVPKDPRLDGSTLTFTVDVLESNLAQADGPASIFIDIIGMPRTPVSFAGAARRTAYRGAFYAGAATEAAAAAPYYHPYAAAPVACGYYPYPPC